MTRARCEESVRDLGPMHDTEPPLRMPKSGQFVHALRNAHDQLDENGRRGPPATPVPITHASPRATTMSTTRHTTCSPGRCVKLMHHIRVDPPSGVQLGEGGDYGYDEAHDFCARRSIKT